VADSSDGFTVLTDALKQHANSVVAAADALDQAADAGMTVTLQPLAYGLMNQMLPSVLMFFEGLAISAIREDARALRSVSDLVREVGLRYENHDEEVGQMFTDLAADGGLSR
jgi:hypothetical protein